MGLGAKGKVTGSSKQTHPFLKARLWRKGHGIIRINVCVCLRGGTETIWSRLSSRATPALFLPGVSFTLVTSCGSLFGASWRGICQRVVQISAVCPPRIIMKMKARGMWSYPPLSLKEMTTAWREYISDAHTHTHARGDDHFWRWFFQQTAVKTISEGRIRVSVLPCFEALTDEKTFLTPVLVRDFDG